MKKKSAKINATKSLEQILLPSFSLLVFGCRSELARLVLFENACFHQRNNESN